MVDSEDWGENGAAESTFSSQVVPGLSSLQFLHQFLPLICQVCPLVPNFNASSNSRSARASSFIRKTYPFSWSSAEAPSSPNCFYLLSFATTEGDMRVGQTTDTTLLPLNSLEPVLHLLLDLAVGGCSSKGASCLHGADAGSGGGSGSEAIIALSPMLLFTISLTKSTLLILSYSHLVLSDRMSHLPGKLNPTLGGHERIGAVEVLDCLGLPRRQ